MISQNAANPAHRESVTERLRAFMDAHGLSLNELAALLRTPPEIVEDWFKSGQTPPPCLLALTILLAATVPRSRSHSGANPNTSSLTSDARALEEGLRRVRAI